jgi:AraC family transcriptional regulator
METIYSEPRYEFLSPYRMVMARRIGNSPEEEVIKFLQEWVSKQGVDPKLSRSFGFDIPVSEELKKQGIRGYEYWIAVPEHVLPIGEVKIGMFAGGYFIVLRITAPFDEPLDRIPKGWQVLVDYVQKNNLQAEWCANGSCLEEVIEKDSVTYMDIFIKLKEAF